MTLSDSPGPPPLEYEVPGSGPPTLPAHFWVRLAVFIGLAAALVGACWKWSWFF